MLTSFVRSFAFVFVALLAACGGGGGDATPASRLAVDAQPAVGGLLELETQAVTSTRPFISECGPQV
ncbi:MAG: hypothetical protein HS106_07940 [Ideonella sp.]|nr:MAG: hypothetical protein F9K36_18515 [Burkholderiaceae bacterium]MBE7420823.1 hypothetical protein [Ideonella sp.]MBE7425967.1 hypothetical protein [Ideonella sp.]